MAKRRVFGRRRTIFEDKEYSLELREDGLYVRKVHSRRECKIPFRVLVQYSKPQLELNLFYDEADESNKSQPVPDMQEGPLVPDDAGTETGPLHARGEQPPEDLSRWQPGMDSFIGPVLPAEAGSPGTTATIYQLPSPDPEMDGGHAA